MVRQNSSNLNNNEMTQWNDKSWQKDFLNMKCYFPPDTKLFMRDVNGFKDAWHLGVLHVEYERLIKIQEEQQSKKK